MNHRSNVWRVTQAMLAAIAVACAQPRTAAQQDSSPMARLDTVRLVAHVAILAADSMEGRRVGTPGGARGRRYVLTQFNRIGLSPLSASLEHSFRMPPRGQGDSVTGMNVVGVVRGTRFPDRYVVVSAHYDHVGFGRAVAGDSLYNGADDNASGTGALLAIAEYFARQRPQNSIIFAAFDGEESGLRGARAFVAAPPVPAASIAMNVNMDMVSRSDKGELFAVGTFEFPALAPYVDSARTRSRITLRTGHEGPSATGSDNWTSASDHGAFRTAGIPYLYFGVEDHPDYHRPSDEFGKIQPAFYAKAVETVLDAILAIDRDLSHALAARRR